MLAPGNLAEFLERANSALGGPPVPDPQKAHTKAGLRSYQRAVEATAEKLRGTPFWVEGDPGETVALYQTWGQSARNVLVGLVKARSGEAIALPSVVAYDAVRAGGRVEIRVSPEGEFLALFGETLSKHVDLSRLHLCPLCKKLYWGRKDKTVCSLRCRVARFRKDKPERWQGIQVAHEQKRARQERLAKQERDREECRRLELVRAPTLPRTARKKLDKT
jgi:hypothetical protein